MEWLNKLFGAGVLDPELEKRLTAQQRQQMGGNALFDAGLATLAASGPSPYPVSLGQALAQGIGAGRQAYGQHAQALQAALMGRQEAERERAYIESLPPAQRRLAEALGMGVHAKMQAEQAGRVELEGIKAANRAPKRSSHAQTALDILGPGAEGTPEYRELVKRLATQSKAPVVNVNTGAPNFKIGPMTPEEAANEGLPGDRRWQRLKDGRVEQIAGTAPTKADEARSAKSPQAANAGMLMDQMSGQLDAGLTTGPWNELFGIPIGRWSSQEKEQFEGIKEQLSSQIRAIFRIPGEGTLSDKEQAQYGLTLPSLDKRPETNRQLIENLRKMVAGYVDREAQVIPNSSAGQSGWRIVGIE